jgi:hypothetical protein
MESYPLTAEAIWPKQRELQFQLQICPWLFLPRKFSALECYQEALSHLPQFVAHRKEAHRGTGEWKSLALRSIGGDPQRTSGYERNSQGVYEFTPLWEKCPATRNMLELFTNPEQCERIRFMLLEPGAEIEFHNDAPEKFFSPALNIALNMPTGCEFWVDLNSDGTRNRFSQKIPITGGTAFLFNSANYHEVKNNSAEYRIHIIAHGPLRFTEADLLKIAQKQNGLEGPHAAFSAVCKKRSAMGIQDFSAEQAADLFHLGVRPDSLPDFACLGILQEQFQDPLLGEEAHKITQGSLHPLSAERVPVRYLETWLQQNFAAKKEFAILVAAGNFLSSSHEFWLKVMRACCEMTQEETPLMGQLLTKEGELPHIHPQFFLLHIPTWMAAGQPGFAGGKSIDFPSWQRSAENVHSDYTPLWLSAKNAGEIKPGTSGFGSEVLATFLRVGKKIKNVSSEIRQIKKYAYPELGRGEHWWQVVKEVKSFCQQSEARVYPFNTERLLVRDYRLVPDLLIAPCAGLKPIALFRQLRNQNTSLKVKFVELNPLAMEFYQRLLEAKSQDDCLRVLTREVEKDFSSSAAREYCEKMFASVLMEGFANSIEEFLREKDLLTRNVEFLQANYLQDHERLLSLFTGKKFFFWHSNAWQTNAAICNYGELELRKNYRDLVAKTRLAMGCGAFTHKSIYEAIFGEFLAPTGVFTMGGKKKEAPKPGAFEAFPLDIE